MLIVLHIVLAFSSIGAAIYSFFRPSKNVIKTGYYLAGVTLSSGVLLVVVNNASLLRTCISGIALFAGVSILNTLAMHKLAS